MPVELLELRCHRMYGSALNYHALVLSAKATLHKCPPKGGVSPGLFVFPLSPLPSSLSLLNNSVNVINSNSGGIRLCRYHLLAVESLRRGCEKPNPEPAAAVQCTLVRPNNAAMCARALARSVGTVQDDGEGDQQRV